MPSPNVSHARGGAVSLASPWFVAALVLAAAWWTLDLAVLRSGAPHPSDDHWEDHLIARHLLAGDGFRTHLVYPPLWSLYDPRTHTVPVLVHGPLLPLLTVPALRTLGPATLDSVAPAAALLALLALIPIFRLGARYFGAPVGGAACLLFTGSPLTLEAVHHSGSVVLGAALITWTLDLLARERPDARAAGLVAGVSYLVRPETLVALPVLIMLVWRSTRARRWPIQGAAAGPWPPVAVLVGGFSLIALPWWIHHARAVGSPFFSLTAYTLIGFWGARPDVSVLQDFALTPAHWPAVMRAELPHMAAKWIAFFPHAVKNALFTPSGGTGWLAVVGLIAALGGGDRFAPRTHIVRGAAASASPVSRHRFAACALLLALIPVASMTLTAHERLYVMPFAPLYALGAALGASTVVRAMPEWARRPRAWIGVLVLLMLPSSLPALRGAFEESRLLARRITTERAALARDVPAASVDPALLFSDTPDFVAWSTGRPTLWVTRDQFERLYPAGDSTGDAARFGLPPRAAVAGWFHDDFRNPASVGVLVRP